MKTIMTLFLALSLPAAFVACDNFNIKPDSGEKVAIQFAVMKYIENGSQPADRARRIDKIVTEAMQAVDNDITTTLDDIEAGVRDRIDWQSLGQADSLLVSSLIDAIRDEIQQRIDEKALSGDKRLVIKNVLQWVVDAVSMTGYG